MTGARGRDSRHVVPRAFAALVLVLLVVLSLALARDSLIRLRAWPYVPLLRTGDDFRSAVLAGRGNTAAETFLIGLAVRAQGGDATLAVPEDADAVRDPIVWNGKQLTILSYRALEDLLPGERMSVRDYDPVVRDDVVDGLLAGGDVAEYAPGVLVEQGGDARYVLLTDASKTRFVLLTEGTASMLEGVVAP